MTSELEQQLRSQYPKIFADWDKPLSESAMSFGLQCGDGWYGLIDQLCLELQHATDHDGEPQFVASQVKQKWGSLQFHAANEPSEVQSAIIQHAQTRSAAICEICGGPGQTLTINPRKVGTRCAMHAAA
ncbi:hypothetical protein [Diaphorobacter caeni]|uniref:hypothetical protein n=1 Tax=Diaphorobacter caeni TaxID=2784387 RepID=UPI001890A6B5|nr:hypothetical protein [Diaphorobacter caeni]MBF5007277.1 hypothetical protein [Diaphorobacter caeni]